MSRFRTSKQRKVMRKVAKTRGDRERRIEKRRRYRAGRKPRDQAERSHGDEV